MPLCPPGSRFRTQSPLKTPLPFAGTNFQGYSISEKDGKLYGSWFCCIAELTKLEEAQGGAPTSSEMAR